MKIYVLAAAFLMVGCVTQKKSLSVENLNMSKLVNVPLSKINWEIVYDGGGQVRFEDGKSISIRTQIPQGTENTSAALVVLKDLPEGLSDYVVRLQATTHQQLRSSNPNEWEVFWFLSNYRIASGGKKEANYFVAKPKSGIELGTIYQEVGQDFLKTESTPVLSLGRSNELVFIKRGPSFRVYKNQELIMDYQGSGLFQHPGSFGLYAEDAWVSVEAFSYMPL